MTSVRKQLAAPATAKVAACSRMLRAYSQFRALALLLPGMLRTSAYHLRNTSLVTHSIPPGKPYHSP